MKKRAVANTLASVSAAALLSTLPGAAFAQASVVMPLVVNVGAWLVEKVGDHYADKVLDAADEALAKRYKNQLEKAGVTLKDGGTSSQSDRAALQGIEHQIAMLNVLLASQQGVKSDPGVMETKLREDLAAMQATLSKQDQRVAELQSVVGRLQAALGRAPQAPLAPSPALATLSVKPSFDCAKAKTFVEHEICDNAPLAGVDAKLGRVYWQARNSLPPEESQRLRLEQLAWLRRRDYLLTSVCVAANQHLDTDCAIFFWNERIVELQQR